MKLNQKFIKQLSNGEIAVENNGTVEQLREVLKAAFPDYSAPDGSYKYYLRCNIYVGEWDCYNKTTLPTFKISDFYEPELFTGWAKDDRHPDWMAYFKEDIPVYGFNVHGHWRGEYNLGRYSSFEDNRPATHEEIEKALIKEAKRRGYKKGVTCLFGEGKYKRVLEVSEFTYNPNWDNGYGALLLGGDVIFREEDGQWAKIVEQPKPLHYLVDGVEYSFNYQELKEKYLEVVNYSDEVFMDNLPEIAHLACIISYFKGLGVQATISDKGIIHELIHLMTSPEEPSNDLQEIREKFNRLIQLV